MKSLLDDTEATMRPCGSDITLSSLPTPRVTVIRALQQRAMRREMSTKTDARQA